MGDFLDSYFKVLLERVKVNIMISFLSYGHTQQTVLKGQEFCKGKTTAVIKVNFVQCKCSYKTYKKTHTNKEIFREHKLIISLLLVNSFLAFLLD